MGDKQESTAIVVLAVWARGGVVAGEDAGEDVGLYKGDGDWSEDGEAEEEECAGGYIEIGEEHLMDKMVFDFQPVDTGVHKKLIRTHESKYKPHQGKKECRRRLLQAIRNENKNAGKVLAKQLREGGEQDGKDLH